MKILMLSWEYPPNSHGGLARHVQDLSEALAARGEDVWVLTQGDERSPADEEKKGVRIIRTEPVPVSAGNFIDSILQLNFQLIEKGLSLLREIGEVDIIHGHDWLACWASKVLKHALIKPLIYTIHATEFGRNQGIYTGMQRYINDLEWYATFEAWKVIVCSDYMRAEVKHLFQLPSDKVVKIANGVNEENYRVSYSRKIRERYASPFEKIVFYVGRLVREKGIEILIQAIPEILSRQPSTKFIIAGRGPGMDHLRWLAEKLGVADRIYFTGFVDDKTRNILYQAADVAVFPSLYEPFGIVALEAMITRTPVIVSRVGGLEEFVQDGENGLTVSPGNSGELAAAIAYLLGNEKEAARLAENGYQTAREEYSWQQIARETMEVYRTVFSEYKRSGWFRRDQKQDREIQDREITEENLSREEIFSR